MKLLYVGMTENRGGTETFILNTIAELKRSGSKFDINVLDITKNGIALKQQLLDLGVNIVDLKIDWTPLKYHLERKKVFKHFFEKNHFDVIHVNSNTPSDFFLLQAAKAAIPTVKIVYHSHNTAVTKKGLKRLIFNLRYPWMRSQVNRYSDVLLSASVPAGQWMYGRNAKFEVIDNGIFTDTYRFDSSARTAIREELGIDTYERVFAFIGRLAYQKYPEMIAYVLSSYREKFDNQKLPKILVLGDGDHVDELKSLLDEKNLYDSVNLLGVRNDIPKIMSAADFLFLPSRYEAMPFVVVEAQAAGLKILQSTESRNAAGEITTGHRFVSIEEEIDVWSQQMFEMTVPTAMERIADNDKLTASKYNMNNSVKRVVDAYES